MKSLITVLILYCLVIAVNDQLHEHYDGNRNGSNLYYPSLPTVINSDTIEYILYDDFETWDNKHVNTVDGLLSKWQVNTGATKFAGQSIVNVRGYGNVWRSTVLENEWQSLELNVSLADTTSELWMDYDYYADPNFNHNGALYLASNWKYVGDIKSDYWYVNSDKWIMHKKTLWNRAVNMGMGESEFAKLFGYIKVWGLPKKKFIYS